MAGLSPLLQSREAQNWQEVPCKITQSHVETHRGSDSTTYSVEIRFTYEWEGKTYHGENYSFGNISTSGRSSKEAIVRQYPEGSAATCFVNPQDPYKAVINTDPGLLPYGMVLFSSVFIVVGAGLIIFGLRRKPNPGPNAALQTRADPQNSEVLELAPVTSRWARTAGIVIIAVIWCGISSLPIVFYFQEDGGDGLLLIFGLVFCGIGLFLLFQAGRSLLALRNPLPRVRVGPGSIEPGSLMSLSWRLRGSISRLSNLAIYLEGIEIAEYRQGSGSVTDRSVFFQQCLYHTTDPGSFQAGAVEYQIPEESVPSMKTDHNEILWQLVFVGDIPMWPDLCETYRLPLRPANP